MPGTVVVPLDGSQFAERALRPAAEVARLSGARVVVVTALRGSGLLHSSHPAEAIVEFAGKRPRAFLALSTHGRTGLELHRRERDDGGRAPRTVSRAHVASTRPRRMTCRPSAKETPTWTSRS